MNQPPFASQRLSLLGRRPKMLTNLRSYNYAAVTEPESAVTPSLERPFIERKNAERLLANLAKVAPNLNL